MDLEWHRDLVAPPGCPMMLSFTVGPGGDAVTAWAAPAGHDALTSRTDAGSDFASFPVPSPEEPVDLAVVVHAATGDEVIVLPAVTTAYTSVHQHPLGFLVVGARCRWRPDGPDRNALLYDRTGALVSSAVFGDGIEHAATTSTGRTWVGYFDEGVFGNFGWDDPGPPPVGRFGINCFTPDLTLETHAPPELDIADCYAMTVDGESLMACCYTSWDIARIDPSGEVRSWSNDIGGARQILAEGDRVALIGGYGDDGDRVVVGRLGASTFEVDGVSRLLLGGAPPSGGVHLFARGGELHAASDRVWFRGGLR